MPRILDVEDLHKEFTLHILDRKTIRALDRVSFGMDEGEIIGLTGKSGAGKSTLMKCVHRTYLASGGRIVMHTKSSGVVDLATADEHQVLTVRRTDMTYCSQFLQAIPRVPAIEVVSEGLLRKGSSREDAFATAKDCFERLGLPQELWDAYPATFSGGEQQRINITRAIISKPRFLLVDEPTASLDLKTKDAVIDMLLELKKQGTSIILITHDEHTLNRMADRCLHLENGTVRQPAAA
ncbi:MAG TPA: ATP-binding cassette domain-containing protein [Vicinamibacterales bacterium]|nr:ATP-binding cassette domain-containing protein [Vicinamibacterales bacterium]